MAFSHLTHDGLKTGITSIDFPEGTVRARRVVTRSRSRPTGKFPSVKMGRMMQWESPNERNAIILLDTDPNVSAFYEQPCEIRYVLDGEEHKHFPDLLVCYGWRRDFWEVKTANDAERPDIKRRTAFMMDDLPRFGYGYQLAMSNDLAAQPRLRNCMELLRLGSNPVPLMDSEKIRLLVAETGGIPWSVAQDGNLGKNGRQHLCRLVLEGHLRFDISQAWTGSTLFTPGVIRVLICEG